MQRRWLSTVREKSNSDHLSRLKPDISLSPAFLVGTRHEQTILSRLRCGTNNLNASKAKFNLLASPLCACGEIETVHHFLLRCPMHESYRTVMIKAIRTFWKGYINDELLLGVASPKLNMAQSAMVVTVVATFVRSTKRNI